MSGAFQRLRNVWLFDGLDDDDLERVCRDVEDVRLEPGQLLFREGEWGDRAYVVTEGEVEILKASRRREVLLAVRTAGEVIGEMALLQQEPRNASVRARTAVELLAIPKEALDEVVDASPRAARAIFETFVSRLKTTNDQLKQSERMAQLGTLTAGVAHELNNPAAAVGRAARRLEEDLAGFTELVASATGSGALGDVLGLSHRAPAEHHTDPLARSDAEAELEDRLEASGVPDPWQLSPGLVDAGLGPGDLDVLLKTWTGPELADALRLAAAASSLRRTTREIADAAGRISAIVGALKGYAYLDQAPVQDVDVRRGLEDTLVLLADKTRPVRVIREFADDLPTITALGTELNQVWTNLIDNACAALSEISDRPPTLTLRAHGGDHDTVVVEVEDNGPGIPDEIEARVFDAFFTTKPPGEGTGLGLQLSYRIVVVEHGGELTVDSQPGRTTFRVTLPVEPGQASQRSDQDDISDATICEHLETPMDAQPPGGGCQECLEAGDTWVHLRYCDECGKVGCCDDSKNRHARKHAAEARHPVIRSLEPHENWAWCFEHQLGIEL